MINERKITERVMGATRARYPGSVIIKHADRSTLGVPDFSVSVLGATCWVEMKFLRTGATLRSIVKSTQLTLCHQLHTVTDGKCWVVVFEEGSPETVSVWTPRSLFMHLWPKVAGPNEGRKVLGCAPLNATDGLDAITVSTRELLGVHGAIRITGWSYHVVTRLVEDAIRAA